MYRATELKTKIGIYSMLNLDSLINFTKEMNFFFLCKKICLFQSPNCNEREKIILLVYDQRF
jgi:hypothetical protein